MSENLPQNRPSVYPLSRIVVHSLCDLTVTGQENIPDGEPFIIAPNHLHHFDAMISLAAVHDTYSPATAKKHFNSPLGYLLRYFVGVTWIEQESPDKQAIRQLLNILKHNRGITIAPEGTRSKTGGLQKAFPGPAFVARKAKVPLLPWAIHGTEKVFKHPRPKVYLHIGKPYWLPEERISIEDDSTRIMCALAALLPEKYHGYYAGHPYIEEMRRLVT